MKLRTVLGPIDTNEIEFADGHGHVWIDPPEKVNPKYEVPLKRAAAIEAELKDFRSAGGSLIVDCQPGECGRDARMLRKLSETTSLHFTATTGFHREVYYPYNHWLWSATEEKAANYFLAELTEGLRETDEVLATTIKVGYEGALEGQTRVLMEAVAATAAQTGVVILFHTEQGRNIEALPYFFEDRNVNLNQLYLCHVDKRPDYGLHRELAEAGILLGYDTFVRTKYDPDKNVWPLLKQMTRVGLGSQIAICLDLALSSMWQHYGGGPGLLALPEQIYTKLRAEEIDDNIITGLVGQNVVRFLAREKD